MLIEGLGLVIQRMNKKPANAKNACGLDGSNYGAITVTPISRPVVKGANHFFWQRQLPISHSFLPATAFEPRPFLQFMAASA